MPPKKNIDLVIFDLDGTLIDSKTDIVDSVNFTLTHLGLPERSGEEITSFIGTGLNDLLRKSLGSFKQHLFSDTLSIFSKHYRAHAADTSKLYPYVKEVLEYLKNKTLFVVTNKRTEMAWAALKNFGIGGYFNDVIGGDNTDCLKPSPCPLNQALNAGRSDKDRSMIVGDMDVDIKAGKAAGILTCAATYGIGTKESLVASSPDYSIDNLLELTQIIV